jgi:Cytochrome c7 and related cytochrome c
MLEKVAASIETGDSIEWVKVHKVPDYAYFNHSAHVNRGVSCVECHGRIDEMTVVRHDQPLSMAWCLDCHRNPDKRLRPLDQVTNLGWSPEGLDRRDLGQKLKAAWNVKPPETCGACHR